MTFDWQTEYARALHAFGGDTPGPALEQELLSAFQQHPQAVTNAITKIAKGYANGSVHSPWGALKSEIPKQIQADIRVGDGGERKRAIANAEQWLKNAGLMFNAWSEVEDELYRSYLEPWRKDTQLRAQLNDLWTRQRIIGIQVEEDEIARANAWKANRHAIENLPKHPVPVKESA